MDLERRRPPPASESLLPRARMTLLALEVRRSGADVCARGKYF
jgi:hypothetical protein